MEEVKTGLQQVVKGGWCDYVMNRIFVLSSFPLPKIFPKLQVLVGFWVVLGHCLGSTGIGISSVDTFVCICVYFV